jgi:hypothetical protein
MQNMMGAFRKQEQGMVFTWAEEGEEEVKRSHQWHTGESINTRKSITIGKGLARTSQSQSTRDRELEVMFTWEQENRNIRNLLSLLSI